MPIQDLRVRTNAPLTEAQIAELAGRGLRVVSRIPDGSYRLRGDTSTTAADLVALHFVDTAAPYDPMDKLDPSLGSISTTTSMMAAGGGAAPAVTILVSLDPEVDSQATAQELAQLG